ncbi:rhodanese-like domain-containing protein [Candidatus Saccharibacteria bacterium]|nr:rhodanese-like domain-containing protein [Candidatus Saccharibacteria bacterium]
MNSNIIIVDVREPAEYLMDHVEGAINLPPADLMNGAPQLKNIDKNTQLILYCRSGSRSNASMQYLRHIGFTNLVNGINADHVRKKYLNN